MNLKNIYSVKNKELSVDELKQHNLIISFSILTQLLLIGFTIVNFFSHKIYSSYNNLSALFVLILISLYYKKTTNFNAAFTAFLITIVTLVSIQHLLSSTTMYTNILWLPVLQLLALIYLKKTQMILVSIYSLLLFSIASLLPHYLSVIKEPTSITESNVINIITFLAMSFSIYFVSKKMFEEEIGANNKLKQANQELNSLNESNMALLSLVTHDLSSPLTVILNYVKFLDKDSHQGVTRIESSAVKMKELIDSVRKVKALEGGKLAMDLKPVSLRSIVTESVHNLNEQIKEKEIEIELIYDQPEPETYRVYADSASLQISVIQNILTNAIKFSNPQGRISFYFKKRESATELLIKDNGIGIPKKLIQQLYSFSAKTSREGTLHEKGTGYGMPIMKFFMDKFKASVIIKSKTIEESSVDHGTTFHLIFKQH